MNVAGLSPDAYVQMTLQLAWYKSRGSFTATYETALTRAFDKARTETIRTLSEDSRAWVLSMTDASATVRYTFFPPALVLIAYQDRDSARAPSSRYQNSQFPHERGGNRPRH